jgi:arylsulfatase A-like enzyme
MRMFAVCLAACVLAAPIDHAHDYFTGLARPHVERVTVKREGGPVILIVVDAMRPDHLSPYGYRRDTTPNLTALANDGVVLTNYFVNGNWTRPSTASLLTGLPPSEHGVERDRDRLADDYITLAELLRDAQVPTGAVVGNGNAGSAFGLGRGFDFYADTVKHWKGLPSADQVVELAVPFVRKHRDEPFFLMLFFVDPHDPYHAPPPYEDMYVAPGAPPLIRSPHWELGNYTPAQIERMQATYDGALHYTDTAMGRFFDTLRELGVYDKATIIVTADHGEAFGEHNVFLHAHHLYDEIVRAPLLVRSPNMSVRGAYHNGLFQTIDLMPTLVRYFGGTVPKRLPGADIFAHLARPELVDPKRFVICEFHNFGIHRRMIRDYEHKVVYEEPADEKEFLDTVRQRSLLPSVSFGKERFLFFDLVHDPKELHNLYTDYNAQRAPWHGLIDLLKTNRIFFHRSKAAPVAEHVDADTLRNLRSLGYVQ